MTTRKRRSQWASNAALQALVRYGPEEAGLKALAQQARANYQVSVNQAHGTAAGIVQAVNDARPEVTRAYDQAGLEQARAASVVGPELAALGPVANAIKASALGEATQGNRHLLEARANSLAGLGERKVQAASGEQFAVQNARKGYVSDIGKVLQQSQALSQQKGAFTASTINSLAEAYAQRALSARNSQRTATTARRGQDLSHQDRQASIQQRRDAAKGKRSATGAKLQTADKHLQFQTAIEGIANAAKRYKGRLSRRQIVQTLTTGRSAQTLTVDRRTNKQLSPAEAKNNPNAMPVHLPSIPQYGADIKMTAALDVALDGHLSRATQKKLAQAGFRIKDLNLPTYGQWKASGPTSTASYDERRRAQARRSGQAAARLIPASR